LGWFLKKMGRGRVTVTACGLDVIWPRRWYQWMLRRTLPSLDRVVCISRATAEEVRRRGVVEEKIVVISPGVWMEGGVSVLVNIPSPGGRGLGRGDLLGQHMAERLQQEQPEPLPHTPAFHERGLRGLCARLCHFSSVIFPSCSIGLLVPARRNY
ncbi:glycosyltransferase, partial [Candidatus Peregrinibacteria bacterium]|nr:glycosyltransferase [Candidatus Peregrinibacteria bacterium]